MIMVLVTCKLCYVSAALSTKPEVTRSKASNEIGNSRIIFSLPARYSWKRHDLIRKPVFHISHFCSCNRCSRNEKLNDSFFLWNSIQINFRKFCRFALEGCKFAPLIDSHSRNNILSSFNDVPWTEVKLIAFTGSHRTQLAPRDCHNFTDWANTQKALNFWSDSCSFGILGIQWWQLSKNDQMFPYSVMEWKNLTRNWVFFWAVLNVYYSYKCSTSWQLIDSVCECIQKSMTRGLWMHSLRLQRLNKTKHFWIKIISKWMPQWQHESH